MTDIMHKYLLPTGVFVNISTTTSVWDRYSLSVLTSFYVNEF